MDKHLWFLLGLLLPLLHFGLSRCLFIFIYMMLFFTGLFIYVIQYLNRYKMDHIRARFVEGSLVNPPKCLYRLKPYFIPVTNLNHPKSKEISQNDITKYSCSTIEKNNVKTNQKYLPLTREAFLNMDKNTIIVSELKDRLSQYRLPSCISGYSIIDEPLNQIIEYIFRDYIEHWYYIISDDQAFLTHLKRCLKVALGRLCQQLKNIDLTSYLTKDLVEDFVNHLKIYKATLERQKAQLPCRSATSAAPVTCTTTANPPPPLPTSDPTPFSQHYGVTQRSATSPGTESPRSPATPPFLSPPVGRFYGHDDTRALRYSTSEPTFEKMTSPRSASRSPKDGSRNSKWNDGTDPASQHEGSHDAYDDGQDGAAERVYFQVESDFENGYKRHDLVCMDRECQNSYFRLFTEIVLYILIPTEEYTRSVKTLLAEILVNTVLVPVFELFSDPDYINQIIIMLCTSYTVTSEHFLDVIRMNECVEELEAVREIVMQEISLERSKDSGGNDDVEIKQRLQSLTYLKKLIESRCKRLIQGTSYEFQNKLKTLPSHQSEQLLNVRFEFILDHTLSLDYFLNYLSSIDCQNYMYFYLTIESFRSLARQHIPQETIPLYSQQNPSNQPINIKLVRNEAQKILDHYLIEKAPHYIRLNQAQIKVLRSRIKTEIPNPAWFDDLQYEVLDTFLKDGGLFENFKHSSLFVKMLAEMDLLPDARDSSETSSIHENDTVSGAILPKIILNSSDPSNPRSKTNPNSTAEAIQDGVGIQVKKGPTNDNLVNVFKRQSGTRSTDSTKNYQLPQILLKRALEIEFRFDAHVTHIVVSRESDKTYAMYAITVSREPYHISTKPMAQSLYKPSTNGSSIDSWCVYRRYSEFHDLHMNLRERFPDVGELRFPPKKPFGNMTKDFLEKRLKTLDSYLKALLAPEFLKTHKGLKDLMEQFLIPGPYEKWNGQIARTMDTFVNPLKSSVRFMGSMVKTVPENIADGVIKVSDTMMDGVGKLFNLTQLIPGLKPSDNIVTEPLTKASLADIEDVDNIALKILILLMDEVFDLKTRNQWLRRRLMVIVRQVVQVTYGGTMNKKILEQVEWVTSPDQVSKCIVKFRDSFWPNGVLGGSAMQRNDSQKARTKVLALAKIFAAIPDEIRTVVGSETTKEGVKMTFDLLQHKSYNKRYLFAILERFCPLIFPAGPGNKIVKILVERFLSASNKSSSHRPKPREPKFFDASDGEKNLGTSCRIEVSSGEMEIRHFDAVDEDDDEGDTTVVNNSNDDTITRRKVPSYDSISLNTEPSSPIFSEDDRRHPNLKCLTANNNNTNNGSVPSGHLKGHKRNLSTPLGKNVINFKN